MRRFDAKKGEAATLTIGGTGFHALHVTVSGHSGFDEPALLLSQRIRAKGATSISFEHEFRAGQLDEYERLQVDPVLYGKAGSGYKFTVAMRNASDESPTLLHVATGTLIPSRQVGEPGDTGCDAPLILIPLQAKPKFDLRFDEKTGVYIVDARDLGIEHADLDYLLGKAHSEPKSVPEFEPLESRQFPIERLKPAKHQELDKLVDLSADFSLGTGAQGPSIPSPGLKRPSPKIKVPDVVQPSTGGKLAIGRSTPVDKDAKHYPVWYGTNRTPVLKAGKLAGYSAFRDTNAHYGRCVVRVPKSHKIGETGSHLWKRIVTLTDDRLTLEDVVEVEQELFWTSVAAQVRAAAVGGRHVVVFIHGYNVSFDTAAIRAAQLGCDLTIDGAMAFYSWPSRGTLEGYFADEATVQASAKYITQFLQDIVERADAEKVHVIAHSMGNRAALEAVRDIVGNAQARTGVPFSQFILAAPDVDAEYFRQFAEAYQRVARRTTMYVSDRDHAVQASRFLHGSVPRVGLVPPMQIVKGIDTVYVGKVDESLLGHGYVANAWQLLNDMHQLIHLDAEPKKRSWVRLSDSDDHWVLEGVV